jgi:hypothetical protein
MRNDLGACVVVSAAAAATSTKIRHALQARVCILVICVLPFGRDSASIESALGPASLHYKRGAPGLPDSRSRARRACVDVNRYKTTCAMSTNIAPFAQ